jgi:2-methylcitrate dehydratase PrpD
MGLATGAIEVFVSQHGRLRERALVASGSTTKRIQIRTNVAANSITNKQFDPLHNSADRDHYMQYVVVTQRVGARGQGLPGREALGFEH